MSHQDRRPSRDDVARRAGVSGATVSYVLNSKAGVTISAKTQKAVWKAARVLGYEPSHAARALAAGRSFQIGVVGLGAENLFSPYHGPILKGIWRAASQAGCRLVLDSMEPKAPGSLFKARVVDGVIAISQSPESFPLDRRHWPKVAQFPVATVGGGSWAQRFHTVDIDNVKVGRAAADYLWAKGQRDVLILGGYPESSTVRQRRQGFGEAFAARGATLPAERFVDAGYEPEQAYPAARELLRRSPRPTAIFCISDGVAVGLLRAARELGIEVPRNLSVLGVDASPLLVFTALRLTSFRQPLEAMGEAACGLVLARPPKATHTVLDFDLVEGDSVRELPGR